MYSKLFMLILVPLVCLITSLNSPSYLILVVALQVALELLECVIEMFHLIKRVVIKEPEFRTIDILFLECCNRFLCSMIKYYSQLDIITILPLPSTPSF